MNQRILMNAVMTLVGSGDDSENHQVELIDAGSVENSGRIFDVSCRNDQGE